MLELKGLIVFQEYEIAIAAYNRKGVGVSLVSFDIRMIISGYDSPSPRGKTAIINENTYSQKRGENVNFKIYLV